MARAKKARAEEAMAADLRGRDGPEASLDAADFDLWKNAERVSAPPLIRPRLGPPRPLETATLEIAATPRPRWEYLARFLPGDPSKALTEAGLEGWELVFCREASEQLRVDGVPTWCKGIYGVFKRPAGPASAATPPPAA